MLETQSSSSNPFGVQAPHLNGAELKECMTHRAPVKVRKCMSVSHWRLTGDHSCIAVGCKPLTKRGKAGAVLLGEAAEY